MSIKAKIRTIPDHPKPGIQFRDITTLLKDADGLSQATNVLVRRYRDRGIAKVAGIESRGFIVGAILAQQLHAGFVPVRKKGRLPAKTIGEDYALEYGRDRIEIHLDAISSGERVLVVDDLIATGGTAEAATRLVTRAGGEIVELAFLIDLPELGGRERLERQGHRVFALTSFEGE